MRAGDGSTALRSGDLLRFTYSSDRDRWFALFNRDMRAASVFYPEGQESILLHAGRDVPLQFSVELDDAQGSETVHAVFCSERFEVAPLRAALEQTGRLAVPAGCQVDSRTLRKEPPR